MVTSIELLSWLQSYIHENSDGEWEHDYGVEITTTDNPGWHVQIDINGTNYEGVEVIEQKEKRSSEDWIIIGCKDGKLFGAGGPNNLMEILQRLRLVLSR